MEYLVSLMRYISPVAIIVILLTCIISLFRNRPRIHKLAKLVNEIDGSTVDIMHWETSIGRSKSNDITLQYTTVYRFHAVIAKKRRDWVITDTTDKGGNVAVNGQLIDGPTVLENGDEILIGSVPLTFVCDEAVSTQSRNELRNAINQMPTQNIAYGVLVDVKTKRPVYLKSQDVLLGRGNDCDIQILSETVSSNHARIYRTSRGWALVDLDSHNGTKLNGRYINQPQLIFDGDLVTIGDKVFVFYDK
ncbi:MAG: FHA domain-containing protein [Eubacterium sp.]